MADQKSWLWRKISSEKTILVADKVDIASREHEEEIQALLTEKGQLERDLRDLSTKLSSAIAECNAKDDIVKKHAKTAQEALAGWEKAEAKALSLKEELNEALEQRESCEQRTSQYDAALKECMQQLRFVREDQENRIHDVLMKASKELEETKKLLEEKLSDSGKKIVKLSAENSQLNKVLLLKEQLIEELNRQRVEVESDAKDLLARLEGLEKDNNTLLYEVRVLEKEVDIRNEEREFNRRTADATHKQHLENVKKIAKLESECQRLRVLVRKRLPGPAALAKMKSEVDILQRDSVVNRRKNPSSNFGHLQLDYALDSHPESPSKKIDFLTERVCVLEEENNSLRETLQKRINELQISRNMYLQTASKLSQVEAQLEESPKIISHDLSLVSMSEVGSDDKASCAGSWASALISELEQFKDGKDKVVLPSKSVAMSDIGHLMDDFAEMEKFALVCVEKPIENSSPKNDNKSNPLSETTGKELVPISSDGQFPSKLSISISKLIEIIEGINLPSQDCNALQIPSRQNGSYVTTHKNLESPTGYVVRVFQWKTSEIAVVLQNFLRTCEDSLSGKADFEIFTKELTSALEWIINHCFSLQDVSSMKETIKKQFEWDETKSETEMEARIFGYNNEEGKLSAAHAFESLRNQLQKSESTVASLQEELEALRNFKAMNEDQFENNNMAIEDLNSQLLAVGYELDEAHQKIASLETVLKNKVDLCEELDAKCLDLKLQLERVTNMDTSEHLNQDKGQLRTEWEISAASEKLAECQETILHLGKQLKALASPREAVVSDKFISTPTNTNTATTTTTTTVTATATTTATAPTLETIEKKLTTQRSSLLDQMQAEDDELKSPKTKEIICAEGFNSVHVKEQIITNSVGKNNGEIAVGSMAIVPTKKHKTTSGGLLKKLLWRKKKGSSKKVPPLPFA